MARPPRRRPLPGRQSETRLGEQVIQRRAEEMARANTVLAEPPIGLEARESSTSVGGVTGLSGPPEAPAVLEGEGPPPPEPAAAAPVPQEAHPAAGADGLNPEFSARLNALIAASGGRVRLNSGYRSYEDQKKLWDANPNPDMVAPPGKSNHNRGLAGDLGGDLELAHRLAPQFGLVFPMKHEPWHIEAVGLRQDASTPPEAYTAPGIKEKPTIVETIRGDQGPVDMPVEMMAKLAEMAAFEPIDFARHLGKEQRVVTPEGTPQVLEGEGPEPEPAPEDATAAAVQGGGEPPAGDMDAVIRWAMGMEGITDEQAFATAHHRMMVESGGQNIQQHASTRDVNSGGNEAFGPWQFVRGTFQRFMRPGFEDWHNPAHQALAFFRAVKGGKYRGNFGHPELTGRGGWSP